LGKILQMKANFLIPDYVHPKAKIQMDEIIRLLSRDKSKSGNYSAALQILADSYHIYFQAMDILLRDGIVQEMSDPAIQQVLPGMEPVFLQKMRVTKAHPALKIATDAQFSITKLLIQFNLTPKSNKDSELPVLEESSPVEKFINNSREIR